MLSEEYIVSGQGNRSPSLGANAKLGQIAQPTSKNQKPLVRWEKQMVPSESGIVLVFHPPFDPSVTQKLWLTGHDAELKKLQVVMSLPDKRIIAITGTYGSAFPKKYIDRLLALSGSNE
jgi:hypothetical protein